MLHNLEETKKFVKEIEKYPEEVQAILFDIWNCEITPDIVYDSEKLSKDFPALTILSCVAGLNPSQLADEQYKLIAQKICFNYLKQFNADLF